MVPGLGPRFILALYCMHGVRKVIPPGFYGAFGTNTTFSAIKRCGGQKFFCWGGVRHTVADGFMSTGGHSSYTRSAHVPCTDPQYYCKGGAALRVPDSWFSNEGRTHAQPCGASKYFCVAGVRHTADAGYYTAGGLDGTLRTLQRPCGGAAWYCAEGVRKAVPAGYVGAGGTVDTRSSYTACGRTPGERVYCWAGVRRNVDPGYEGIGPTPTTRTAQQRCTPGMRGCGAVHVDPHVMASGSAIDSFMALFHQKKQAQDAAAATAAAVLAAAPPPHSEMLTRLRNSIWGSEVGRSAPASP